MITIQLTVTGRSYQLAEALPSELQLADGSRISDALQWVHEHLPDEQGLPATCLVAIGNNHVGTANQYDDRTLQEGDELVLIAPVAGG